MILFIDSILTPYQIARYNALHKAFNGSIEVWFQDSGEKFRNWKKFKNIRFKYEILNLFKINILGSDLLNIRINTGVIAKLNPIKHKIDQVIITGWDQPICLIICLWAKKNKIRVTLRAGSTLMEKSLLRTITMPYVKWFVKLFDNYISYGTSSSNYLVSLGAQRKKILNYYNTVDVKYFMSKSKNDRKYLLKKNNIKNDEFVILSNGRFVRRKQFYFLIKVFKKFNKIYPKSKLIIVGDGPELKKCKSLAGNLLNKKIYLPGFIQHDELPDYYYISNLFVLSSSTEVWGLVVNEAMSCGLPVLTSNTAGCVADLIVEGKTGYIFNPNSQEELLSNLVRMYNIFLNH